MIDSKKTEGDTTIETAETVATEETLEDGEKELTALAEPAFVLAGRYEVLGLLGAGGMGTVYRARDRELDEIIALKTLRKEHAANTVLIERFRQEVKLARRVTHPSVARTFDIGEDGGDRFLTMELVEGEMLRDTLRRRGRLPPGEAVAIARNLTEALAAAHEAGVLHRDLKPENIIVRRSGRAVITDFGIARALDASLGRSGAGFIGTPAYMAPEQVEGAPDLDGRVDLYALGCILFELLTGAPAWEGDTIVSIAARRLTAPPPDPRTRVPELSPRLAEIVLQLMARQRDDRFASAADLRGALDEVEARPVAAFPSVVPPSLRLPNARKLAVLPIINESGPEDDYIAHAIGADLVDRLIGAPAIDVRSLPAAMRLSAPTRDAREAGRAAAVDAVVDGRITRRDARLAVVLRVVTVEDGYALWARRFDVDGAQVSAIGRQAAAAIAETLTARITSPAEATGTDPAALDLFHRGRFLMYRSWFIGLPEAITPLENAYALAPGDARIAGTYALVLARAYGAEDNDRARAVRAREAAEHALANDPHRVEARVALATVHLFDGEATAAAAELRRALATAPTSADALDAAGRLLVETGRYSEGLAQLEQALALEPHLAQARYIIARTRALMGEWDRVDEALGPMPEAPGASAPWLMVKARLLMWRRDRARAAPLVQKLGVLDLPPGTARALHGMLGITMAQALPDGYAAIIEELLPVDDRCTPRRACFNAQTRAEVLLVGDMAEAAMHAITAANDSGLIDVAWMDGCPLLAPLRSDPRFGAARASVAKRAARAVSVLLGG